MPPPSSSKTLEQPAAQAAKVNCVTPANDPELIFIVDELKKLKDRAFYGAVTLKLQNGIVCHYTTEESKQVPNTLRLPGIPENKPGH